MAVSFSGIKYTTAGEVIVEGTRAEVVFRGRRTAVEATLKAVNLAEGVHLEGRDRELVARSRCVRLERHRAGCRRDCRPSRDTGR